ncbi:MAG: FliH/SctL family protein [Oscillospiraceae bacterium]|nr:FliH/SctL family protein [Oscillospiraceae bacterium]
MFRIDRSLVKISGIKFKNFDADENSEVGAEGELPDATTSAESAYSMEAALNQYISDAEIEINKQKEEILDQAKEEAASIIFKGREDAEEERQKGWQEGFEEGSQKGKTAYDEQLAEKIKEDDEALKRVLDELYEERDRTFGGLEEETTKLALEIVRKIINPAEDALGDVFTSLIKNALRQLTTDSKIVIRVGPTEYERFFSSGAAEIELDSGAVVKAAVLRDVSLNEGDCIIDTDDVTVNAGIDSQLKYVELAFERANQYEPE